MNAVVHIAKNSGASWKKRESVSKPGRQHRVYAPHSSLVLFEESAGEKKQKEIRLPENYLRRRNISPLYWSLITKILKIISQI